MGFHGQWHLHPWEVFRESTSRPLGHNHNEAHVGQKIQGCLECQSWVDWISQERRDQKEQDFEQQKPQAKRISLSLEKMWLGRWLMVSSSVHCQVLVRTSPPMPTEVPTLWPPQYADKAFSQSDHHMQPAGLHPPDSQGTELALSRLPRQSGDEGLQPEGLHQKQKTGLWESWVTLYPPFLHVRHSFSLSEFYVQPAIKTGKTSKSYTHPRKCWFAYSINNPKSQQMQMALHA